MSKSQSNKIKNNTGLIGYGLIGLGCITALGVGAISLPVAIGIGAVTFGALGAIELANISKNNEVEIEEAEAQREIGREIGEEIAREHLSDPATSTENSSVIKKYRNLYEEEKRKDAKFKFRVAYVAKEIAIDFTRRDGFPYPKMLEAYKGDIEFKNEVIAISAFDEVAKVIKTAEVSKKLPNSSPSSASLRRFFKKGDLDVSTKLY